MANRFSTASAASSGTERRELLSGPFAHVRGKRAGELLHFVARGAEVGILQPPAKPTNERGRRECRVEHVTRAPVRSDHDADDGPARVL